MEIKKVKLPKSVGKAYIIDNAFPYHDVNQIYGNISREHYTFTQMSEPHSNIPNTRFATHLEPGVGIYNRLEKIAYKILKKFKMHKKLQLSEVYVNMSDALSTTLPHTDRPEGCWTLLYYANYEWDLKFGGQTNFIDSNMEICASVIPKPGRFILFQSNILHQATPPNFYCPFKRFTIAFKMDMVMDDIPEEQETLVSSENIEGEEYVTTNSCWTK